MCGYNFFSDAFFSLLVCGVIILTLGYLFLKIIKLFKLNHAAHIQDRNDSFQIIKMRFAKGELSSKEYARMKNILFHS